MAAIVDLSEHTFYIHVGDTYPAIKEQLIDDEGAVIDLNSCSVIFQLEGACTVESVAAITDADNGKVSYSWQAGDLPAGGLCLRRWKVTTGAGKVFHVPNFGDGYPVIVAD